MPFCLPLVDCSGVLSGCGLCPLVVGFTSLVVGFTSLVVGSTLLIMGLCFYLLSYDTCHMFKFII
jgi:hypothetical protein